MLLTQLKFYVSMLMLLRDQDGHVSFNSKLCCRGSWVFLVAASSLPVQWLTAASHFVRLWGFGAGLHDACAVAGATPEAAFKACKPCSQHNKLPCSLMLPKTEPTRNLRSQPLFCVFCCFVCSICVGRHLGMKSLMDLSWHSLTRLRHALTAFDHS